MSTSTSALSNAAFGDDPGRWPLPAATTARELWLRAVAAGGQGDDLPRDELAVARERPQGRAPVEDDEQLLVGVVDVERERRRPGRDLEDRGAEVAAARLAADPRAAPAERRRVALLVPVRIMDVGHRRNLREYTRQFPQTRRTRVRRSGTANRPQKDDDPGAGGCTEVVDSLGRRG